MYRWYVSHDAECYLVESSLAMKEGHKSDLLKLANDTKEQILLNNLVLRILQYFHYLPYMFSFLLYLSY